MINRHGRHQRCVSIDGLPTAPSVPSTLSALKALSAPTLQMAAMAWFAAAAVDVDSAVHSISAIDHWVLSIARGTIIAMRDDYETPLETFRLHPQHN